MIVHLFVWYKIKKNIFYCRFFVRIFRCTIDFDKTNSCLKFIGPCVILMVE